jgi:hypothetical protein
MKKKANHIVKETTNKKNQVVEDGGKITNVL